MLRTVNQRVLSSSLRRGAYLNQKPLQKRRGFFDFPNFLKIPPR